MLFFVSEKAENGIIFIVNAKNSIRKMTCKNAYYATPVSLAESFEMKSSRIKRLDHHNIFKRIILFQN